MRKILLSMALLSTVTSEELETKEHHPLLSEDKPQFWLARSSRIPWNIKDIEGRRHPGSKSFLSRISGSQPYDLNRFLFNNPYLFTNTAENSQASNNHQSLSELSVIDKNKSNFLLPFDRSGLSKINLNQERFKCTWDRCRRRTQGWIVQEPLYVEEPNWVQIESESLETPVGKSEPFFVTRGKRSLKLKASNSSKNTLKKIEIQKLDSFKQNIPETESRKKREISPRIAPKMLKVKLIQKRSETDNEKWLKSLEKTLIGGDNTAGMTKSSSYLHPRNKHSDILEILEEPFFISRGKKNNVVPLNDFSLDDFYFVQDLEDIDEDAMLARLKFDTKYKILEKILNNETRRKRFRDKKSNAKRGVLEELDLQLDPFYVARG